MTEEITAVIPTLNEENQIEQCLESIRWVDEIIVIDGGSSDRTIEICRDYGAKILESNTEESEGFDNVRQIGVEESSNDWILKIDADERISDSLKEKFEELISRNIDVVKAPRKNFIFGEWMKRCGRWPDYQVVLFGKGSVEFSDQLHSFFEISSEASVHKIPDREGYAVQHYSHDTVEEWIEKLNRYTSIEAEQSEGSPSLFIDPLKTFFVSFLVQRGLMAGKRGLALSILDAQYSFNKNLKMMGWKK